MLKTFAAMVSEEMELRRMAKVDQLTGTLTRRAFLLEAEKAINRFVRHKQTSALVLFDIDHFKQVNDTFGHPAGDEVLRSITSGVTALLRKSDVMGRLGGEEFGVLVVNSEASQAYESAERYRKAVEMMVFEHDAGAQVTASFGIAQVDERLHDRGAPGLPKQTRLSTRRSGQGGTRAAWWEQGCSKRLEGTMSDAIGTLQRGIVA